MTNPINNKTVLITGCRGFTARHLYQALHKKGYKIYGITVNSTCGANEYNVDITDKISMLNIISKIRPDFIIHLAGISFVEYEDIEKIYKTNLLGTLNLLTALDQANHTPIKCIIASSANIYGDPRQQQITEKTYPKPINHYAISKLAMEHMVAAWFHHYPIIITRPFNYTGPGQADHFVIPKIVSHYARKKSPLLLGNIHVIRDISDVRFVVEAYIRLLESPIHSEIFNICSGIGLSINKIINTVAAITGYNIEIIQDPALIRNADIQRLVGCNKKLFNEVGEIPLISMENTLSTMLQQIKEPLL